MAEVQRETRVPHGEEYADIDKYGDIYEDTDDDEQEQEDDLESMEAEEMQI